MKNKNLSIKELPIWEWDKNWNYHVGSLSIYNSGLFVD